MAEAYNPIPKIIVKIVFALNKVINNRTLGKKNIQIKVRKNSIIQRENLKKIVNFFITAS